MVKLKRAGPKQSTHHKPLKVAVGRDSLLRIAVIILAATVLPVLAGAGYLTLWHEPALQRKNLRQASTLLGDTQARGIAELIDSIASRAQGTAASPLLAAALASGVPEDTERVARSVTYQFPEARSVRILAVGEQGTAGFDTSHPDLRNHIEVDLIRRALLEKTTTFESYPLQDHWVTTFCAPAGGETTKAVVLVTLDNQVLEQQLAIIPEDLGRGAILQPYNAGSKQRDREIAATGNADADAFTYSSAVGDAGWRVTFTPSRHLKALYSSSALPLAAVLALALLALMAGLGAFLLATRRVLKEDVRHIIALADKKSPLQLAVPELLDLARRLRHLTTRSRLRGADEESGPGGTAEVSVATDILESTVPEPAHDETDTPELSLPADAASETDSEDHPESVASAAPEAEMPEGFPAHVFRAYDIRGIADTELTEEFIAGAGRAIGTLAGERDEQTLFVACDGRKSSQRIKTTLVRSLMESGRDVIDIGMVPTPLLYYATSTGETRSGIMVTGSHNPPEYNGLKIVLGGTTIAAGGITEIRERILAGDFSQGQGRVINQDFEPAYLDEVVSDIAVAVPLKLVIDAGNGVTGRIAPMLFEELGCEVVPLYCEIDGTFPNHNPDTSVESNLDALRDTVVREEADFGVAFDGDGDRLAVVTSSGRIVRPDTLMMVFAQDVVARNPGADVVFDVKCSRNLARMVSQLGGRPVLWRTGHAFMKEKVRETGALLGGEFSGHIFFGERWYGFDDGMYAAGRLAEILSISGVSLDETLAGFPVTVSTPEILVPVPEQDKFRVMEDFAAQASFSSGKVNTLDGVRVDYQNGWGLLRASNTSANLTARFEATTEESLASIQQEFRAQLKRVAPTIDPGF